MSLMICDLFYILFINIVLDNHYKYYFQSINIYVDKFRLVIYP